MVNRNQHAVGAETPSPAVEFKNCKGNNVTPPERALDTLQEFPNHGSSPPSCNRLMYYVAPLNFEPQGPAEPTLIRNVLNEAQILLRLLREGALLS
jgi:hypothetical protein